MAAEPSIASMDLCRLEAKHEPEKLAKTVMQRGKMSAVEIAIYLTSEMKRLKQCLIISTSSRCVVLRRSDVFQAK